MAPTAGPSRQNQKHRKTKQVRGGSLDSDAVLGVQKIKSALRQTRRLLAKGNLAADVRMESERRLKSLEGDLAKAERARKERDYAVRYHKIKFFERQKLCRKIKRLKKELETQKESAKKQSSLQSDLLEKRVDLNYILNYPKTQKYISLFPPQTSDPSDLGVAATNKKREELRQLVKIAMENGELDQEPELSMDNRRDGDGNAMELDEQSQPSKKRILSQEKLPCSKPKGVPGDAFFEVSDGDEDEDENHES